MKDYKKILEGVMNIINTTEISDIGFANICAYISENCPELAESADERIRKAIICGMTVHKNQGKETFAAIPINDCIAWLEKQGTPAKLSEEEQNRFAKGVLTSCASSFIDYLDAHKYEGKMCVSNGECEDIENAFHNAMWDKLHRYYGKYIEKQGKEDPLKGTLGDVFDDLKFGLDPSPKQGEKEQDPCENCEDVMLNCHNFPCIKKRAFEQGKSILEVIKEEKVDNANKVEPKDYNSIDPHFGKPIDKVVPKFKVGDWVIFNEHHNSVYQVEKIQDLRYYLRHYTGGSMSVHIDNQLIRHWTIQDAKDGDVLKEGSCIFILRKMKSKNTAITHCCLFDDGDFNLRPTLSLDVDSTFPATEEQRNLLFAKMKEAGYAFDLYNKEMMKIEDLLINGVEIPFGAKDSELEEVFYSIPNGFHAEIEGDKVVIKKGEKKPLSEEDERKLNKIIDIFEEIKVGSKSVYCGDVLELQNWLKLIKERMI